MLHPYRESNSFFFTHFSAHLPDGINIFHDGSSVFPTTLTAIILYWYSKHSFATDICEVTLRKLPAYIQLNEINTAGNTCCSTVHCICGSLSFNCQGFALSLQSHSKHYLRSPTYTKLKKNINYSGKQLMKILPDIDQNLTALKW